MKEFIEAEGVISMSGDYCAWHEASIGVDWVYGKYFYCEDMAGEYLCEELDCDWDDLKNQDKATMDEAIRKYVNDWQTDYTDIENGPVLLEIVDGEVKKVWQ